MALYGSVPLLLAHNQESTVGVFWGNPTETWIDIAETGSGKSSHWISEAGVIDLWLLLGPTPADVFVQYSRLTGSPQLPPMFAIGYHQCRWNYRDEPDVKAVDAGFDEHRIPYDVLWLDIEHTDGKRYFTWDPNKFPTPEEMQNNIASKGRKMVTIIDPHLKRDSGYYIYSEAQTRDLYVKNRDGNEYDGWCWPGSSAYLDFVDQDVRDWWSEQFDYSKYKGSTNILYTWNDMNEPSVFNGPEVSMQKDSLHRNSIEHREVHNVYGSYMQEATYNGQLRRNPEPERPFVLSRAFYAGSQRWGAIWTGDNTADWGHLSASNPMLLSIGLAGIPFAGADVGGFFEKTQDPTLMTRWWQLGAYQPFFRGHGHLDTKRREPWLFGEPYTTHIRAAIQSRYIHLPYLYTLFHQAHSAGLPVMRPMWVEFPRDAGYFDIDNQFMLGDALLVRSVGETENSAGQATVHLPPGRWYETTTWKEVSGPLYDAPCPLSTIPVFQRGGTIIPKKERLRRSSSQMAPDPFTIQIAVDQTGSAVGTIYLDDGFSFKYEKAEFLLGNFTYANGRLQYKRLGGSLQVANSVERIRVLGVAKPSRTTLSYDYDDSNSLLTIRKPGVGLNSEWELDLE